MANERSTNRANQKTQQMRVDRQTARKARLAAAVLDMTPGEVIDEGMKLYAEKRKNDPKVVRTLGSLGFKPNNR